MESHKVSMEFQGDSMGFHGDSIGFHGYFKESHGVSMEFPWNHMGSPWRMNFTCSFPRGNSMGYETRTAILQEVVCGISNGSIVDDLQ